MTSPNILADLDRERAGVERSLARLFRSQTGLPPRLKQAMGHSLLGGGKRLRPILFLWSRDAVAGRLGTPPVTRKEAVNAACALEMLHTYSLIHDDLPAMDDDVLRRGKATCHVAFDEATAILAGDGLQALGLTLLARHGGPVAGALVELVGHAIGPAGMVGGQQLDLDTEGQEATTAQVNQIHRKKTGYMLAAALGGGGLLGGGDPALVTTLQKAGLKLGLAFQGADDLLDVSASAQSMGKSPGKDEAARKATWIRVEGVDKARQRTRRAGLSALRMLEKAIPAGPSLDRLLFLGTMMWDRDR